MVAMTLNIPLDEAFTNRVNVNILVIQFIYFIAGEKAKVDKHYQSDKACDQGFSSDNCQSSQQISVIDETQEEQSGMCKVRGEKKLCYCNYTCTSLLLYGNLVHKSLHILIP